MEDEEVEWDGPSTGAKWLGRWITNLRDGGVADARDGNGLTARVVGEVGAPKPRTGESGAILNVALRPSTSQPRLYASAQAITTHQAVFILRSDAERDTLPTVYQRENAPPEPRVFYGRCYPNDYGE